MMRGGRGVMRWGGMRRILCEGGGGGGGGGGEDGVRGDIRG